MSSTMLNCLLILAILVITILLIWEGIGHAETTQKLNVARAYIGNMRVTLDRYKSEKIEAQAIADHAIDVIAEARDITAYTIYSSRIRDLERGFVNRRQIEFEKEQMRKQKAAEDQKFMRDALGEIDQLTGGI